MEIQKHKQQLLEKQIEQQKVIPLSWSLTAQSTLLKHPGGRMVCALNFRSQVPGCESCFGAYSLQYNLNNVEKNVKHQMIIIIIITDIKGHIEQLVNLLKLYLGSLSPQAVNQYLCTYFC